MPHFMGDRFFRNCDYPNVEQIKRLTAELRELGEKRIRLAELHSRDCCVSAYGKLPLTPSPSCCPPCWGPGVKSPPPKVFRVRICGEIMIE